MCRRALGLQKLAEQKTVSRCDLALPVSRVLACGMDSFLARERERESRLKLKGGRGNFYPLRLASKVTKEAPGGPEQYPRRASFAVLEQFPRPRYCKIFISGHSCTGGNAVRAQPPSRQRVLASHLLPLSLGGGLCHFSDRDCGKNGDIVKHALRDGCKGGTGIDSQVRRGSVPTGFRKTHVRENPECRLHGQLGRCTGPAQVHFCQRLRCQQQQKSPPEVALDQKTPVCNSGRGTTLTRQPRGIARRWNPVKGEDTKTARRGRCSVRTRKQALPAKSL